MLKTCPVITMDQHTPNEEAPKVLWCADCVGPVCFHCTTLGDCGTHLTSRPEDAQGTATRVVLPGQMVRFWRRPFMEKSLDQLNIKLRVKWGEEVYLEGTRGQVAAAIKFLAEFQESARMVAMAPNMAHFWGTRKALAKLGVRLRVTWGEEGEEVFLEGPE